MKHYLHYSLRALFLLLAVFLSLPMLAVEVEIGGINYELVAKTKQATVISKSSVKKYSGDIVIPESVKYSGITCSVTSIGEGAFRNCSDLTSVTIPNSVTSIGERAFEDCEGLTSVHISDLAAWCNIEFGTWDSNPLACAYNGNATKLYLNGEEVKDLTIPNSVTSIGNYAFNNYSNLTSVAIPNSVTSIGEAAFEDCEGMTSLTIGSGVTSIGSLAFSYCTSLTSVTIPNSVTSVGEEAFSGCEGLISLTIGSGVTSIEPGAFTECTSLTSVTIPNSVTSIKEVAFGYCEGLTSVTIGSGVTSIGEEAFVGCTSLTSVTIPNSVTSIGEGTFQNCSSLTSLTIPNSVTSIEDRTFYECASLTSMAIPNSVTSIGGEAFYGCDNLTSVIIPNSVTSIGFSAFSECYDLNSVHISDLAAWCNIEFGTYDSNPLSCAYNGNATKLYLNGEEVKDLIIPNSVTSIGNYAFHDYTSLTSVTIPNSVTSIGVEAFYNCEGLTSLTIPNSVTSIGEGAFEGCSSLTSLTIPNSVTSIGEGAFHGCGGLTSLTIPNSVTSIGAHTFAGCRSLTSVVIPNSVTYIGMFAFDGCSGLTSVTIPNSVTSIDNWAFGYCENLLDVYCYAEDVPSVGVDVFEDSPIINCNLHVPAASIESYKAKEPWSGFGKIIGLSDIPKLEKCATPFVIYANGKLSLSCQTEGAEFVTKIASEDINTFNSAEIELNATYNIEVFASKVNYENSDTVNVALVWVENGKVGEESGVINVEAAPVLIQANGGNLTINGVAKGCEIVVYTLNGTEVARATATEGSTTINTGLQSGTVAIVRLGNKSMKIKI